MLVLYVALLESQSRQSSRTPAKQFVYRGGERVKEVVSTDVKVNQGLTVETVGQVGHVYTVQAAVGQLQA